MANDESLRRMLQDRFRDHQVEPSPGLEKAVLSKLAPSSPWWKTVGGKAAMGVGGLLVGAAAWLLLPMHQPMPESSHQKRPQSREVQTGNDLSASRTTSVMTTTITNEGISVATPDSVQRTASLAGHSRPNEPDSGVTAFRLPSVSAPAGKNPIPNRPMIGADKQPLTYQKSVVKPTPDKGANALAKSLERLGESTKVENLSAKNIPVRVPKNRVNARGIVVPETANRQKNRLSSRALGRSSSRPSSSLPAGDRIGSLSGPMLGSSLPATAVGSESSHQFFISKLAPKPYRIAEVVQKTYVLFLPETLAKTVPTQPTSNRVRKPLLFNAGIMAGPQLVYQLGHQPYLGWSAGVWGAVRLSPKLSLETGLTASQPTVLTRQEVVGVVMIDSIPSRQSVKQTQTWWNLDVPLLVRYQIRAAPRWQWSLAAGLSSAVSINARQISDYTITKFTNSADTTGRGSVMHVQTVDSSPQAVLFQPFRWLRVSLAIEFADVGGHKLLLEPYFGYPIGGVTNQLLRVGMVGLQLRLQLGSRSTRNPDSIFRKLR